MEPPETITCVDCGGVCHVLTVMDRDPEDSDGDPTIIVAYRCEDCLDRWDVEFAPDED